MTSVILSQTTALSERAAHMLESDPHGYMLALVSVCFVFSVLLILFFIYGISGEFFIRREVKAAREEAASREKRHADEALTAAAVALAVQMYLEQDSHDIESGIITISHQPATAWHDAIYNSNE